MRKYLWLVLVFAAAFAGNWLGSVVHAQTAVALTIAGMAPHTTCLTPVAGQYYLCQATDGTWVSNNGGAYFQILPSTAVAGVTSWNGLTGAVIYTPPTAPVMSVNGKTGAIVLTVQ